MIDTMNLCRGLISNKGMKNFLIITFVFLFARNIVCGQEQDSLEIRKIEISGNTRTKAKIILRELPFEVGQKISTLETPTLLEKGKINLLKTSLFNFAEINWKVEDSLFIDIQIVVQERWFFIPKARIHTVEENLNIWAEKRDFNHISTVLSITDENTRGNNEKLTLSGSIGYNKSIEIAFLKPSYVINKKVGLGMSVGWSSNKEAPVGIFDYKTKYLRMSGQTLSSKIYGSLQLIFRPALNVEEQLSIGIIQNNYDSNLVQANRTWYPQARSNVIRFYSKFKIDNRNHKSYPTKGSYYDVIIEKNKDLSFSENENNYTSFTINGRWYKQISNNFFGAFGTTIASISNKDFSPIYGLKIGQSGLEVRSFEALLIPVYSSLIGRTSIKYKLLKREKQEVKVTGNPKFDLVYYALYATFFMDGVYLNYDREANYQNKKIIHENTLGSCGVGIDLNTYYDFVVRLEYSYNFVFKNRNFFIHFKAAI